VVGTDERFGERLKVDDDAYKVGDPEERAAGVDRQDREEDRAVETSSAETRDLWLHWVRKLCKNFVSPGTGGDEEESSRESKLSFDKFRESKKGLEESTTCSEESTNCAEESTCGSKESTCGSKESTCGSKESTCGSEKDRGESFGVTAGVTEGVWSESEAGAVFNPDIEIRLVESNWTEKVENGAGGERERDEGMEVAAVDDEDEKKGKNK